MTTYKSMPVGQNIKNARMAAEITQVQLAKNIGTTQQVIARYESGEQDPTVSRLIEIAQALGVSAATLIK